MKILHIAQDRDAALVAARVLHGIAQNVTATWVQTPASALQWLLANPDTSVVIVEVHAKNCASFIEELRGRGLTMPVVAVSGSARLEPALAALNAGADGYVVAGPSLEPDLARAVAAAIDRERRRRQILLEPLIELAVERERVAQHLARVEETLRQTEQRSAAAATERVADVQARHAASLADETRIRLAAQQKLIELESAVRKADERRASEAVSFADQLATRHAEFTASLAQAAQSRDSLAAELSAVTVALGEARQARSAAEAAAAEHLERREAELRAELIDAVAVQTALDEALAETEAAHQETRQRAGDLAAANERQAALEDLLTQEADRRASLDRELTAAEAAHDAGEARHAAELTRAAAGLADLQARHDAALEENAAARAAFERQSAEAASALETVSRERSAEAAAAADQLAGMQAELVSAAARQAALEDRLGQEADRGLALDRQLSAAVTAHAVAHASLEQRLIDAATAHQQTEERAAAALAAASAREAELVERLTRESDALAALERDLSGAREQTRRFEARLIGERTDADRALRAKDEEIRQLQLEHETLLRRLDTTHDQLQHLHRIVDEERQAHELARLTSESELQRVTGEYGQLRQSFDRLQSAFQTLEQIAGEHATERARLETVVVDRDSQLSVQAERHRVAEQAAQDALAELEKRFRQAVHTSSSEIARLQQELEPPGPTPKRCAVSPSACRISRRNSNGARTRRSGNSSARHTRCAGARRAA
jgi:CheY-like chemotaxis protein/flagellar biosynthesis/type III secretory pathway chaperone